ncbi:VOC family protein [Amycolatopsis sp. NPDC059027]|uniref:VOC family protein n=1 Tax=unclassified Amycolatopsis TaxID=2618356 RepID=UPI003671E812
MLFRDERWPDGTPCWVDLMAPDQRKAVGFYSALLGWEVQVGGEETGHYGMAMLGGRPVAGIGQIPPEQAGMPTVWTTYLAVSDVDKTAGAVTAAGGQILMAPMDVLAEGRMAVAADPTGAVFGLWQPGRHFGTQVLEAPGTQAWNEIMTRDYEAAKTFYGEVFGYSFGDISAEGFRYATLDIDGRPAGGIGLLPADTPPEVPANWTTYFAVADADAGAAKVSELGGTVVAPPADSAYGRVTAVVDDQGASFRLIAPNERSGSPEGWDA